MITIGVTGHRPHRLLVPEHTLARRVRSVLSRLVAAASGKSGPAGAVLDVNSALAEGADQIVAREALALGQRLTALLPFKRPDYEATFGNKVLVRPFRELLRAADRRLTLDGRPARPEAAYVAVGTLTLARADIIVTIWDGKPAQGRGGTPEILQAALEWGIPVIWVHAAEDRKPVLLRARGRGKPAPSLARASRKAHPLSATLYRDLVAALPGDTGS